ncbi:MAG: nucleotidyltransferase family protein [Nanobdellota archaeon]
MKDRITITIDQKLLSSLDKQIDGVLIKNRSHAIESVLSKTLGRQSISQAIILAGGKYTVEQDGKKKPAFLLDVNGRTALEHNIIQLKRQGIKEFIISIYFQKEKVKELLGDGSKLGVSITYVEEKEPLGTAGVLRKISSKISSSFVMCNGDELKEINIKDMFDFHKKQGVKATIAVTTSTTSREYGQVLLNGSKIYSFIDNSSDPSPSLINAGLYIFEPEVIAQIPEGYARLESDLFPKLSSEEELTGYVFYGKWDDLRDKESLKDAEMNW